jgi:TatA/E family protein of Tat protein translocase
MGEFSIFHWLVVLAIVLILFGGRKIPEVMKGLGEGIRNFKDGMAGASQAPQSPGTPVIAPAGMTAKSDRGQVTISWNASAGASTYNLKRSGTSGGPYALIASTAATTYSDEGLASGTFYYVVSAVGANGESANSMEVGATPS